MWQQTAHIENTQLTVDFFFTFLGAFFFAYPWSFSTYNWSFFFSYSVKLLAYNGKVCRTSTFTAASKEAQLP